MSDHARNNQKKHFCIKFFAPIVPETVGALMQIVDQKLQLGAEKLTLLISTPGGNVFDGLSAYNYLRGIPMEVDTHNFGSADSVGVVLFCAGSKRSCVPHARFLLHGVSANFPEKTSLEEKQLEERLKSLKIDIDNIARVIGDTVGKEKTKVVEDMIERTTLDPEQAKDYGLVSEIASTLFEAGTELISIQSTPQPAAQNHRPIA